MITKRLSVFLLIVAMASCSLSSYARLSPSEYLKKVSRVMEKGNYILGSRELYRLSRGSVYRSKRLQIKYALGIAFLEMKLYHLSSLQFVYVIRRDKKGIYKEKAIQKLSQILTYFEDDSLFCPLSEVIKEYEYPLSAKNKMNFYFGKCFFVNKEYQKARYYFGKVSSGSSVYPKALYYRALSYAEEDQVKRSADTFKALVSLSEGITDTNRVAALMGLARVLYQGGNFDDSIKIYRSIPRDTSYFYDSLLENSWNYLRSGKFRSALSNFQSLHSPFYQDRYQPESLILRAYIYLYICKYYEMEKILNFFNAIYKPLLREVNQSLKLGSSHNVYVRAALTAERNKAKGLNTSDGSDLPEVVMNRILQNGSFRSKINYLVKLKQEKDLLDSLPVEWRRDRVGRNAYYILNRRMDSVQKSAGRTVKKTLLSVRRELKRLILSEEYLRYDMLKGKRNYLKKKISQKHLDRIQIDEKMTRNYYIQNGYEYWPFSGETWLDEIGNYHYLGKQNCE